MARFLAVCSQPGVNEEKFRETLGAIRKWRPDRWTFVIKAYGCGDGLVVAECEARQQEHFEQWLKGTGWTVQSIHQVDVIHEGARIWKM